MAPPSYEIAVLSASTGTDRLDAALSISAEKPLSLMLVRSISSTYGDPTSIKNCIPFIACVVSQFVYKRDVQGATPTRDTLINCGSIDAMNLLLADEQTPERLRSTTTAYLKAATTSKPAFHEVLAGVLLDSITYLQVALDRPLSDGTESKASRIGDVVLEGAGFDVVVGHQHKKIITYPGGNTAVIILHDPRDGHFLMLDKKSETNGNYVFEMPKAPASRGVSRDAIISNALRDDIGLSFRKLEQIGKLYPDSHMIEGECDVYYATFDLEEDIKPLNPRIRSVKRITEDGLYQAAIEGRMNCALTLGAISLWRAFEAIRKKRIANSKRVRPSAKDAKAQVDDSSDDEADD